MGHGTTKIDARKGTSFLPLNCLEAIMSLMTRDNSQPTGTQGFVYTFDGNKNDVIGEYLRAFLQ
jgi:hypothetical protein